MALREYNLTSDGFFLRALKATDAERYQSLLFHPAVKPYIPENNLPNSIFDSIRKIQYLSSLFHLNAGAFWALCNPQSQLIGTLGFDTFSTQHKRLDLAFELHPDYQGRGLMSKAVSTILPFGFEDLGAIRIQAYTLTHNTPSIRLLLKSGFKLEGNMHKFQIFNGVISDVKIFGLTQDDN